MEVNKKRYYINYSICINNKTINCSKIPKECLGNNCFESKSNKIKFDNKKKFCRSGKCNLQDPIKFNM